MRERVNAAASWKLEAGSWNSQAGLSWKLDKLDSSWNWKLDNFYSKIKINKNF